MLFSNKQRHIEEQLAEYRQQVVSCVAEMHWSIKGFLENEDRSILQENINTVHSIESRADDIRREVEVTMYSKALFPESRGDILGLLETMDKIPNQAESVVRLIYTHHIMVPDEFKPQVIELSGVSRQCVQALIDGAGRLFESFSSAIEPLGKVDQLETEADYMEAALIERIFASKLDGTDKILLRDLVKTIGTVSDRAENAGDRIRIIVAKRGI